MATGRSTATLGGKLVSNIFGVSAQTGELMNGVLGLAPLAAEAALSNAASKIPVASAAVSAEVKAAAKEAALDKGTKPGTVAETASKPKVVTATGKSVADDAKFLDSSTSTGATVSHGKVSTAIGSDSATMNNYKAATDTGNGHNVIVHGSRPDYDELGGLFYVENNPTHAQQVIDAVLSNPNYAKGSPICMGSCWSASNGTAQQVADGLNATVTAYTRPVSFNSVTGQGEQMSALLMMRRHPDLLNIKADTKVFYPTKTGD
jgi:hypothetical protein